MCSVPLLKRSGKNVKCKVFQSISDHPAHPVGTKKGQARRSGHGKGITVSAKRTRLNGLDYLCQKDVFSKIKL